ncbi:hypothetical protein HDU67_003167 [Dinochytrium kinnereticum]|nr:hypothetical protein HDU67_003167 [Dinochytrium kinnereticum]
MDIAHVQVVSSAKPVVAIDDVTLKAGRRHSKDVSAVIDVRFSLSLGSNSSTFVSGGGDEDEEEENDSESLK